MSLQPQLQIGLTYAYDPRDQIFFLITRSKIASDVDVSIIRANPLQLAFLQGRLWSVSVLGQFSQTQIYKRVQQSFQKAFFSSVCWGQKAKRFPSLSRNVCLCTVWQWQCFHTIAYIFAAPKPSAPSIWQSLHFEHHKGVKEVDVLSENYSEAGKILRQPKGGGESQLVLLTGSWDKGAHGISEAASKCPWQIHNL